MENIEEIHEMINENPNLMKDIEFMKEAIKVSSRLISLDKTNNESLYRQYVVLKNQELQNNTNIYTTQSAEQILEELARVEQELASPKEVQKGKYKIPHKYLFELIRDCEKTPTEDRYYSFSTYFNADGMYDKEFGEGLEKIYDDPDYILGMHGTSSIISKEDINKVLSEGLKATNQGRGPGHLASHVYYGKNLRFLNALTFNRNSPNLPETMFVLKIPKKVFDTSTPIPLYGSNKETIDGDAHILPEYMWGYTSRKAGIEYANVDDQMHERDLIKSQVNKQKYKYGFYEKTINIGRTLVLLEDTLERDE